MDTLLCDELLQEIFLRLAPSSSSYSSSSVSLVSKRWLHLYRSSKTTLSLRFAPEEFTIPSLSSLLSTYPFLNSLSLTSSSAPYTILFSDLILLSVSSCPNLKDLRFLPGPVSLSSILSLSKTLTHLTSLNIILSRPFFFNWVISFPCLKELSVSISGEIGVFTRDFDQESDDVELGLECISISGIRNSDESIGWLWRSSKKLKTLKLKSCEGIGDGGSLSSFQQCLQGLQEVELRTCRSIVDGVLLKLAENCCNLNSLLVYDGGSKQGLLQFISLCRSDLDKLDFRLPLDLDNDHLLATANNFRNLSSLRLQSCCLVTGEGLNALGTAMSNGLEELSLISCDVVEREPGLLTTLGQRLKKLRKLDLSYNETLRDKELVSMLVSCSSLIDLKLRGCRGLTNVALVSIFKSCKILESIDILYCFRIVSDAVELLIMNSPRLRQLEVEESKLSEVAKSWALKKSINILA